MILKNARHERFAQELAKGKSAAEAYIEAGFKGNRGNATTLKQKQSVAKRVEQILKAREAIEAKATERAIERTAVSKEWVMSRLRENAEQAMTGPKVDGATANRALELLGKEIGMFVSRHELAGKDGGPIQHQNIDAPTKETRDEWLARQMGAAAGAAAGGDPGDVVR